MRWDILFVRKNLHQRMRRKRKKSKRKSSLLSLRERGIWN
jgi:hypothetical protein